MARPLPPWLNIAPSQFTEAAISGAQLGQRGASEAAQLGQQAYEQAAQIAQRAQELQARREESAARMAAAQSAISQRAAEAQMQNAIAQREMELQEQVSRDAIARMAQQDSVWQEGMSRYERAINAGDDPEAAEMEILTPLIEAGFGPEQSKGGGRTGTAATSPWSGPLQLPGGKVFQVNRKTGKSRQIEMGEAPPEVPKKRSEIADWFANSATMQAEETAALEKLKQGGDPVEVLGTQHPTLLKNPPYSTKFFPIFRAAMTSRNRLAGAPIEDISPDVAALVAEREKLTPRIEDKNSVLPPDVRSAITNRIADIDKLLKPDAATSEGDDELVPVINPKGKPTRIRRSDYEKALTEGYRDR